MASVVSDSVWLHRRQPIRLPRPWDSPGKNTGVGCHFLLQHMKVKSESEVTQSCLTLHDPMDYSPPGSSVHGIFQARVLEWGAIAFSVQQSKLCKKPSVTSWLLSRFSVEEETRVFLSLYSTFFKVWMFRIQVLWAGWGPHSFSVQTECERCSPVF